jgi:tellurite resistance-related uncharacterized protein
MYGRLKLIARDDGVFELDGQLHHDPCVLAARALPIWQRYTMVEVVREGDYATSFGRFPLRRVAKGEIDVEAVLAGKLPEPIE